MFEIPCLRGWPPEGGTPNDKPQTWMNKRTMDTYREQMRKFYYDPAKYKTYLEQLGITYPTVR